jgi:hypothetical protein
MDSTGYGEAQEFENLIWCDVYYTYILYLGEGREGRGREEKGMRVPGICVNELEIIDVSEKK